MFQVWRKKPNLFFQLRKGSTNACIDLVGFSTSKEVKSRCSGQDRKVPLGFVIFFL